MNPKKMQGMLSKMGIAQEEIDANRVIIETDDKNIIIENPAVAKISMQGNQTFQISGEITEQDLEAETEESNEEDIETIVEKTGCSKEEATTELEKTGDMAEAIINLS